LAERGRELVVTAAKGEGEVAAASSRPMGAAEGEHGRAA